MSIPWSESETLALVRAWGAEVARVQARGKPKSVRGQSAAIHRAFLKSTGASAEDRPLDVVTTRRAALKYLFEHIRNFNETQKARGKPTWFQLSPMHRFRIRRRWKGSQVRNDMTWKVFATMARQFAELPTTLSPRLAPEKKKDRRHDNTNTTGDAPACGKWSYSELMALARSFTNIRHADPEYADQVREARREELHSIYLRYGGLKTRSAPAVVRQMRYLLAAYRFIVAFNAQARTNRDFAWHHRSEQARAALVANYSENKRVLLLMDARMFAVLNQTPSIRAAGSTPRRERSLSSPTPPQSSEKTRVKRLKTQSTKIHRVTEQRHYSMPSRRAVVSVNKTRDDHSYHFGASDSDKPTSSGSDESEVEGFRASPHQLVGLLRRHVRGRDAGGDQVDASAIRPIKRQRRTVAPPRAAHNDYQSLLEHTVTTMSAQLSQLDRRLTEARINENQRMLVSVLRACRQSSGFGSAPAALAREMLTRAGANLLEIADLVEEQEEEDGELRRRLLSSLADVESSS